MDQAKHKECRVNRLSCNSALGILAAAVSFLFADPVGRGADDSVVTSVRSGAWSAARTWETGKVPAAGTKVFIRWGHSVTYDAKSDAVIRGITVAGTLTFATDKDTELNVGLIRVEDRADYSEEGFECDADLAE